MTFYTGREGSMSIHGTETAKVRDWSLETTVELLSVNTVESAANEFVPGVKGATGSATLMWYKHASKTDFRDLLLKIVKTSSVVEADDVTLKLKVNSDSSIVFRAFITSATVSVSNNELVVVPINFTMTGDFTSVAI